MDNIIGRQIENRTGGVGDEARHTETGLKGAHFIELRTMFFPWRLENCGNQGGLWSGFLSQ